MHDDDVTVCIHWTVNFRLRLLLLLLLGRDLGGEAIASTEAGARAARHAASLGQIGRLALVNAEVPALLRLDLQLSLGLGHNLFLHFMLLERIFSGLA